MSVASRTGLPVRQAGFSLSGFGFEPYNSCCDKLKPVPLVFFSSARRLQGGAC